MKKGSIYFAAFILACALFFFFYALTYSHIKTKLLPLAVAVITLILVGIELGSELVRKRRRQECHESKDAGDGSDNKEDLRLYVPYFGWSLGLILSIYLLGFLITIPGFILSFLLLHDEKFFKSALIASITSISLYVVFVSIFKIELYKGIVVKMLA
jgi:hypothetical protein